MQGQAGRQTHTQHARGASTALTRGILCLVTSCSRHRNALVSGRVSVTTPALEATLPVLEMSAQAPGAYHLIVDCPVSWTDVPQGHATGRLQEHEVAAKVCLGGIVFRAAQCRSQKSAPLCQLVVCPVPWPLRDSRGATLAPPRFWSLSVRKTKRCTCFIFPLKQVQPSPKNITPSLDLRKSCWLIRSHQRHAAKLEASLA